MARGCHRHLPPFSSRMAVRAWWGALFHTKVAVGIFLVLCPILATPSGFICMDGVSRTSRPFSKLPTGDRRVCSRLWPSLRSMLIIACFESFTEKISPVDHPSSSLLMQSVRVDREREETEKRLTEGNPALALSLFSSAAG